MSASVLKGKRLAVLFGGTSAERSVSLESGNNVATTLEQVGALVTRIDTGEKGWVAKLDGADFVFNVLHGPGGEDGTMQGFLETIGYPYSGSGVLGSALTMDKVRTKRVWQGAGLPTAGFVALAEPADWSAIIEELGEVFVKPACEGSSIGMSRAATAAALAESFAKANAYGDAVLIEQFIDGAEYTVAVLGDRALPAIRIETDADFYDFDAKYVSDDTRFFCPAGLSDTDEAELRALAVAAFDAVGAEVWGRVDVLRDKSGQWQLLEVNTIPGMTSHSLVPMTAKVAGLSMLALLEEIYTASMEVRNGD